MNIDGKEKVVERIKIFESDDLEGLIEFGKKYNKYLDNMYVLLNENRKYISYHDALKTVTEIRNSLAAFMFYGEDVFKTISMLSGGEKVRLTLCKILKKYNERS